MRIAALELVEPATGVVEPGLEPRALLAVRLLHRLQPLALLVSGALESAEQLDLVAARGLERLEPRALLAPRLLDAGESLALLAPGALDRLQPLTLLPPRPLQRLQPLRGAWRRLQAFALSGPLRLDRVDSRTGRRQLLAQRPRCLLGGLSVPRTGLRQRRLQRRHPRVHRLGPAGQSLSVRHGAVERVDLL